MIYPYEKKFNDIHLQCLPKSENVETLNLFDLLKNKQITSPLNFYAFGVCQYGQLGCKKQINSTVPEKIQELSLPKIKSVIIKYDHTVFHTKDSRIFICGKNNYGQLGLGDNFDCDSPTQIISLGRQVKKVAKGSAPYSLVLLRNGTVFGWGDNGCGQLGLGDSISRNSPCQIDFPSDVTIKKVYSNPFNRYEIRHAANSYALTTQGEIYCWGSYISDKLGVFYEEQPLYQDHPVKIANLEAKITKLSVGNYHILALSRTNNLYTWGRIFTGDIFMTPTQVSFSIEHLSIKKLLAGSDMSDFILTEEGEVFAWGLASGDFCLGLGPKSFYVPTPTKIQELSRIKKLITSDGYLLALDGSGELFTWGVNHVGQLGLGRITPYESIPHKVEGVRNVLKIAAGNTCSLAICE